MSIEDIKMRMASGYSFSEAEIESAIHTLTSSMYAKLIESLESLTDYSEAGPVKRARALLDELKYPDDDD